MIADTPTHSQTANDRQAAKREQQAAALRANLARRKDQARLQITPQDRQDREENRHVGDAR